MASTSFFSSSCVQTEGMAVCLRALTMGIFDAKSVEVIPCDAEVFQDEINAELFCKVQFISFLGEVQKFTPAVLVEFHSCLPYSRDVTVPVPALITEQIKVVYPYTYLRFDIFETCF